MSGWASVQHAFAALLYGAAIVAGGAVEGGVVAYQVGWFLFLAPYGIIAQPIHTTILPELVDEHGAGRSTAFVASLRWAADSMSVLLVPLTALCLALSVPAMSIVAFGAASGPQSVELLAAALASLGVGLVPYGAFFLLARAFYVLGDSRTPALWSAVGSSIGVAAMLAAGATTSGTATVVGLGLAHSLAYTIAAAALLVVLKQRVGAWAVPRALPGCAAVAAIAGAAVWWLERLWTPTGRPVVVFAVVALCVLAGGIYLGGMRLLGISVAQRLPRPGHRGPQGATP
jgi:putative peptidoglycan lipid II flippase